MSFQSTGPRRHRPCGVISRLLVVLVLSVAPRGEQAGGDEGASWRPPPLAVLEKAFRNGDPGAFRSLLRSEDKIYVASPSLGLKPGYYSNDQVYFLIQDIFRGRRTQKFHFLQGAPIPRTAEHLNAVGRWCYRRGKSREVWVEIRFALVQRNGIWILREIRDLP